jgi:hypothetical protein
MKQAEGSFAGSQFVDWLPANDPSAFFVRVLALAQ